MGQDLGAQVPGAPSELLALFMGIAALYKGRSATRIPGTGWRAELRRRRLARRLEVIVKDMVRAEHARVTSASKSSNSNSNSTAEGAKGTGTTTTNTNSRSVLALSLQDTADLTPELLQQTSDNLRVFLFAGHDTTSILMQWALYELHRSPAARRALAAELDGLFGADADVEAQLRAPGGAERLAHMPYATAVIRETLRLHPPAASVRMTAPGTGFRLTLPAGTGNGAGSDDAGSTSTGKQQVVCPDGCIMYLNAFLIQRDRAVWGEDADEFVPERWLGDTSWMPAGAWRPFERGPRSCIGLELANIEAKVILALVVRRYDFEKVGIGALARDGEGRPVLDEAGRYYKTESDLFNVSPVLFLFYRASLSSLCRFSPLRVGEFHQSCPPPPERYTDERNRAVHPGHGQAGGWHHDEGEAQRTSRKGVTGDGGVMDQKEDMWVFGVRYRKWRPCFCIFPPLLLSLPSLSLPLSFALASV